MVRLISVNSVDSGDGFMAKQFLMPEQEVWTRKMKKRKKVNRNELAMHPALALRHVTSCGLVEPFKDALASLFSAIVA